MDIEADAEPIDKGVVRSFRERYLAAWNSHDPAQVAACAAEDVVWDSPALREPAYGRAGVAGLVESTAAAFPDYEFSAPASLAIAEDGLTAYVPWRMTATNTGPFDPPGYAPTGRPVDLRGIDVWQFRNGFIWRYEAVYNYSLIARQLGLAPRRGGGLERLGVHAQRVFARLRYR
jgi:steroid delta-isomerase-like uncharacterized protein